eukprot:TRINITY_DN7444_c0_g1_i10.p1 TRINITY_DN7444_c0_g1~~TRINITY_DN7444_c0_g1_i10.p1  ORF type:complete len:133 (+),score=31.17 TRINITY_DN7444_c0_g1_i10:522-920(+)
MEELSETMVRQRKELMTSNEGVLLLEKENLENTLKALSEEVNLLTIKNERLLEDLRKREFFQAYEEASTELTRLREEYHSLLMGQEFVNPTEKSQLRSATSSRNFKIGRMFNLNCGGNQEIDSLKGDEDVHP